MYLKYSKIVNPKNKEKIVKIIFTDLTLKTLQALFLDLFWDSVAEKP